MLNEGCGVESAEGARRWDGVVEGWNKSKSCVKFGCGVGPAEAGGGRHVCCCEAVVAGGKVVAGAVSRGRWARRMSEDSWCGWARAVRCSGYMVGDGSYKEAAILCLSLVMLCCA